MKQYTIRPLVFIEDRPLYLSSENFGRDFWIRPQGGVFLLEVNVHSNTYTQVYRGEHQTIESAKSHAQHIWEDYLKQYLEPSETVFPAGAIQLLKEAEEQIAESELNLDTVHGKGRLSHDEMIKDHAYPGIYYKIDGYLSTL